MQKNSRSVFVGNIPYDASEEQLKELFMEAGPVETFRLVIDKETGKAKGFGFCEYRDASAAKCAIRNLNNRQLNGRSLRVDFADNERPDNPKEEVRMGNSPSPNNIEDTISATNQQELYNVLWSLKNMVATNPDQATQILASNPVFSVSILRALFTLDIIDANTLRGLVAPQGGHEQMSNMNAPPFSQGGAPNNFGGNAGYGNPPPVYNNAPYQPPQMPYGQPGYPQGGYAPPAGGGFEAQQLALVQQKLKSLPTEQLQQLYEQTKNPLVDQEIRERQHFR